MVNTVIFEDVSGIVKSGVCTPSTSLASFFQLGQVRLSSSTHKYGSNRCRQSVWLRRSLEDKLLKTAGVDAVQRGPRGARKTSFAPRRRALGFDFFSRNSLSAPGAEGEGTRGAPRGTTEALQQPCFMRSMTCCTWFTVSMTLAVAEL